MAERSGVVVLSVTLSAILVLASPFLGRAAQSKADGWSLKMRSNFYGDLSMIVSPIGMRFVSAKTGITVTALPPDGRIIAYNAETKKKFETTPDTFGKEGMKQVMRGEGQVWREVGKGTLAGLKVIKLRNFEEKDLPKWIEARKRAAMQNRDPEFAAVPEEMWISTDINLPGNFTKLMQMMTQLKPNQLAKIKSITKDKTPILVRVYRYMSVGRKILLLDTMSASRTTVTKKDFFIPPGLKKVTSELALLFDEDDTGMGMFGSGDPLQPSTSPAARMPGKIR